MRIAFMILSLSCLGCVADPLDRTEPTGPVAPSRAPVPLIGDCRWNVTAPMQLSGVGGCNVVASVAPATLILDLVLDGEHMLQVNTEESTAGRWAPLVALDGINPLCEPTAGDLHTEVTNAGWSTVISFGSCSPAIAATISLSK